MDIKDAYNQNRNKCVSIVPILDLLGTDVETQKNYVDFIYRVAYQEKFPVILNIDATSL